MMSRLPEPVAFSRGTFTRRNLPVQGWSAGRGGSALMSQPLFNLVHGESPLA